MDLPDTQDRKVSLELMVSPETTVNEEIKVLMETSESRWFLSNNWKNFEYFYFNIFEKLS